jgi:hypothetical protein
MNADFRSGRCQKPNVEHFHKNLKFKMADPFVTSVTGGFKALAHTQTKMCLETCYFVADWSIEGP